MSEQEREQRRPSTIERRLWVRPSYRRMRAGDAEMGPNPDLTDFGFTKS